MTDIGDLFTESWQLFQRRFATLIGLYLLTMVAFMLPLGITIGLAMLAGMAKGGAAFVLTGVVGLLAGLYLGFRCFAAFLHAVVDDQLAFGEALEKGNEIILPLLWIGFLTGFIICGGFILFVIPGIIFMVWFFFAQFILVKEDVHGMNALLKSREYVRGEWFNVALRLLLIWAASVLVGIIPLAGPILCIVFFPFTMIFHYLIYRDLREMKGDVPFSVRHHRQAEMAGCFAGWLRYCSSGPGNFSGVLSVRQARRFCADRHHHHSESRPPRKVAMPIIKD